MRIIKNAIVTGPTGAVGTALCKLMVGRQINVIAVVREESGRAAHLRELSGVEIVESDLAMLSELPTLLSGVKADAFFHLAWAKTVGQGRNDMEAQVNNIQYTLDACRVAYELGCTVFVGAGSQAEYGRTDVELTPETPCFPENGYGIAKLCAGQMSRIECKKLGIDHIWPRILSVYGPYDGENAMIPQVINKLLIGEKPTLTAGEQIWDFLYADDAAEALYRMAVCGKNGAVYPVGYGEGKPLKSYIATIRDLIDPSLPLGFGEIPYADRQVMHLEADINALKADTGFEPRTDFQTGIRKTIEYIRRQSNG